MDDRTTALGVTNIVRSKRAKSVRDNKRCDGRTPIESRNDPPAAKPQEGHPSSEATSDSQHLPITLTLQEYQVWGLVACGFLDKDHRQDREAVADALRAYLSEWAMPAFE